MIAVTGCGGQLGRAVSEVCEGRGIPFRAFNRTELNITSPEAVKKTFKESDFDCIIHCAAYTAVDAAEDHAEEAFLTNAYAPWLLARTGVPILSVSTDYVFDGRASVPYETSSSCSPLSVYGLSKRAGETALLEGCFNGAIVRTAWVYSKREGTKNFYQTIRRLATERSELSVVDDQVGAPTLAEDLAGALVTLYGKGVHKSPMKILHFTNAGSCSWFDFASEIVQQSGLSTPVYPIPTSAYPTKAVRPRFSALSLSSIERYGIFPRHWKEALADQTSIA